MRKHSLIVSMVLSMSAATLLLAPVAAEACGIKCKINRAKEKAKDAAEAAKQAAIDAAEEAEEDAAEAAAAVKAEAERLAALALYQLRKEFLDGILSGGSKTIAKLPGMPDFHAIGSNVKSRTTAAATSAETQAAARKTIVAISKDLKEAGNCAADLSKMVALANAKSGQLTNLFYEAILGGDVSDMEKKLTSFGLKAPSCYGGKEYVSFNMGVAAAVVGGAQVSLMLLTDFNGHGGAYVAVGGGVATSVGAGAALGAFVYPHLNSASLLEGWGGDYGVALSIPETPAGVGVDVITDSTMSIFRGIGMGGSAGKSVDLSLPLSVAASYGYTWKIW